MGECDAGALDFLGLLVIAGLGLSTRILRGEIHDLHRESLDPIPIRCTLALRKKKCLQQADEEVYSTDVRPHRQPPGSTQSSQLQHAKPDGIREFAEKVCRVHFFARWVSFGGVYGLGLCYCFERGWSVGAGSERFSGDDGMCASSSRRVIGREWWTAHSTESWQLRCSPYARTACTWRTLVGRHAVCRRRGCSLDVGRHVHSRRALDGWLAVPG